MKKLRTFFCNALLHNQRPSLNKSPNKVINRCSYVKITLKRFSLLLSLDILFNDVQIKQVASFYESVFEEVPIDEKSF